MEDKQIYTSARSEEIKRQLISLKNKFKKALDERAKKQKEKKRTKKPEVKVTPQETPKPIVEEKTQNIQIKTTNDDEVKTKKHKLSRVKRDLRFSEFFSRQRIFNFFIYFLFAGIVLIIGVGIFLTYFKK